MQHHQRVNLALCLSLALAVVLVLLPFHAFLTVWASSIVGHYTFLRAWKDGLLLLLLPIVAWTVVRRPALWHALDTRWIFWASVCYVALHIGLGLIAYHVHQVSAAALEQALVVNLRPLLMFWLCLLVGAQSPWLKAHWRWLVLAPGAVVIIFGLAQVILPNDFLHHFGYGPATILPYETVDQKVDYLRVQSFLRGANPLGVYLILIITAMAAGVVRLRRWPKKEVLKLGYIGAGVIVLALTYSRGAWLGTAVSLALLAWWGTHSSALRQRLVAGMVVAVLLVAGGILTFRHNDHFENTFFHTDEHSQSALSSNSGHFAALRDATIEVANEPFGRGPGTAGPASAHNLRSARIAENYYLQIAQETGWFGLALFIAISGMIALKLWRRRHDTLARVLLASFIGISVVNLISHAWTDDTISLLWWGLAGISLAPAILPVYKQKQHGTKNTLRSAAKKAPSPAMAR